MHFNNKAILEQANLAISKGDYEVFYLFVPTIRNYYSAITLALRSRLRGNDDRLPDGAQLKHFRSV